MQNQTPYIYPGALHIHTTFSDGRGTVPEVIEAAQEMGLRWIIITDHDTLAGREFEGWHDDLFVLIDHEVTPIHSHFLAFHVDKVISRDQPTQSYIDETYSRGGFGVLAHPDDHLEDRKRGIHPWKDWSIDGPSERAGRTAGLELWNVMSDWRSKQGRHLRRDLIREPGQFLEGPTPAVIAWWDRLNREGKRTFGIGGLDAHGTQEYWEGKLEIILPYEWMFGTLTNYLLLDAPLSADKDETCQQIYAALREGRTYFVNRLDGSAPAMPLCAWRGDAVWYPGATIGLEGEPLEFVIDAGPEAEARLVYNGEPHTTTMSAGEVEVTAPGFYRLEARRNNRPWLYTNPIYVTE